MVKKMNKMNAEKADDMRYEAEYYVSVEAIENNHKLKYKANFIKEYIMEYYAINKVYAGYDSYNNNKIEFIIKFGFMMKYGITVDARDIEEEPLTELLSEITQIIDKEILKARVYKKGKIDE
jgi:hypothetical protein